MSAGADRLRPEWTALPLVLRARIVDAIGGRFLGDVPAQSGFSAAYAGVVTTTKGKAFVKACARDWHPDSLRFLRAEMRILTLLPPAIAPAVWSEVDETAGVALVLEAIDGHHPGNPWSADDLQSIAETLSILSSTKAPLDLPDAGESMSDFTRWQQISHDERLLEGLPPMVRERMTDLLRIEQDFREAVSGDVIAHDDVRADNILISDGRARFLDWPHARRGAPWIDLPCLLPSVEASGGPSCEEAWPLFEEHGAPPMREMLPVISGFASYLWHGQAQPEIPQLPGLRAFQRAQAGPALRWLAALLSETRDRAESSRGMH
ncbi:aminoglycoside phosphotransferase family protein [Microbacterium sp. NPDC055988]|uniref:aminoglycoside phosphotransferase family protein n=1 Tax=Microbacterium sp. NPDC055988 TaxID=3345671 RepID=UPI0035DC5669